MSMYPSLEDMKMDEMVQAQNRLLYGNIQPAIPESLEPSAPDNLGAAYPNLSEYMGIDLANFEGELCLVAAQTTIIPAGTNAQMIAPLSGQEVGLKRAQVTNGVRQLLLCKDKDGKVGLRVKSIDNGVFVCLVIEKSPAALVGLRFGDQILQINGENVAGYSMEKVHEVLRKSPVNGIAVVVRDRPFERTVTLHKDSVKTIGVVFKNGKITSIVKDSSAARNGVLINHQILEVQGQNVVGMKDKEITKLIDDGGDIITLTIIPSMLYDHMIKHMSGSLIKKMMDHSILNF